MDFEISYETQTILPIGNDKSKIIDNGCEYLVDKSTFSIMEHSCEYFGSSYEGRKEGTKQMIGITHKPPIIVEESRKIIFFPTTSPDREDCVWINLNQVQNYRSASTKRSLIKFRNGDELELDMSIGSLTNQILRATRLKFVLDERINKKSKDIY